MTTFRLLLVGGVLVLTSAVAGCGAQRRRTPVRRQRRPVRRRARPDLRSTACSTSAVTALLTCEGSGARRSSTCTARSPSRRRPAPERARHLATPCRETYRVCRLRPAQPRAQRDGRRGPATRRTRSNDLHRLLAAAKVGPPYVLLGASFGGLSLPLRQHLSRRGGRHGAAGLDVPGRAIAGAPVPIPRSGTRRFDAEDENASARTDQPLQGAQGRPALHRQGTGHPGHLPVFHPRGLRQRRPRG